MLSPRRLIYFMFLFSVLAGSFLITLWLTAPQSAPDTLNALEDAEHLASYKISTYPELENAARDAQLYPSEQMKGSVDAIIRLNAHTVRVAGWAADPKGDGSPINILVFAHGAIAARTQTKNERPDVARVLNLNSAAEKNIVFSADFDCHTGDPLVLVGVGADGQYLALQPDRCP